MSVEVKARYGIQDRYCRACSSQGLPKNELLAILLEGRRLEPSLLDCRFPRFNYQFPRDRSRLFCSVFTYAPR